MSKSPNYMSRQGWKPDMIVLHVCEGTFKGSVSWLCNKESGTSSHYVTGKNGELEQLVDLDKAAWCNGTSTTKGAKYDYRRATNKLVKARKTNANYYTISIENEGYSYKNGYGKLTTKQYNTLLKLMKELITKYNIPVDRDHIVGHYEIAPKEKPNCPGSKFQWDQLMKDLTEWKNGTKEEPKTPSTSSLKYAKNDKIILNGYLYKTSTGTGKGAKKTNYKGTITIVAKGASKPYHIDKLGWVTEADIKKQTTNSVSYYKKCASKYTSIVDALKSINVNSSFRNRKKIAKANSIKLYAGLPSQNTKLLNLLKKGKLVKA